LRLAYFALDLPHKGQASYIHINEIVQNLRKLGWEVDLHAPEPAAQQGTVHAVTRVGTYANVIRETIARLSEYDALYVRSHLLAWPVTSAAARRGMPVLQEVNGTEKDVIVSHGWLRPLWPLVRWLYSSQFRASSHLLPVTQQLAVWLESMAPGRRATMISNAANTDLFKPMSPASHEPFVVFFGGLTAWHGVDVMIDAVSHAGWPKGVKLRVIGAGAKQQSVADAIARRLPVEWLGQRPYEEIPSLISGALAGLIPITNPQGRSSTGVLPLKLYETLACGIPAIVSDLPGQADLVRDGQCGVVIPCGDSAALAKAVASMAADPAAVRDMGQRGVALVQAEHSWAARARDIDCILRQELATRLA
jgi:glycosyltransferase involved in cell wall biosynthesis